MLESLALKKGFLRQEFLVYELRLFFWRLHVNFMTINQILHELQLEQTLRQPDRLHMQIILRLFQAYFKQIPFLQIVWSKSGYKGMVG